MPKATNNKNQPDPTSFADPQNILDNAPIGVFTSTPDGRYISVNHASAEMLGYDNPRELISSITDIASQIYADPADRMEFVRLMEKHGEIVNHECRLKRRDGTEFWVSRNVRALKDENNHIVAYQGFTTDITERKLAEEALAESEERFKALHNASFGGIFIHDKGIILECNKGLSEISGYKYDELIGMDGLLLISEKSREKVMGNIVAGYEKPYEVLGIRKNGQEYPLRLEARNIPYNGKQVRVVECRDITEQKKTEEEAKYREDLIKLITDNMFDLVALTDLKGNFEFAGKSYSILGYDHDYLTGKNVLEFVHPDDRSRIAREFNDFAQLKDRNTRVEYRYRCRNGSYLWLETIGKTVQQTDFHPEKLLFSTRDITRRKQEEEKLKQSKQSLDKQIRLLNGFLDNAPDILSIKKHDLTIIRYNKTGYEFLKKNPEEVHGNKCYELIGRQSPCHNCASIDAIRTKKPVFREKYVPELNTHFSCRANPIISENGKVEYVVEIIRDISVRKKTEEMQKIFFQMLQNSEHIAVFKDSSLKYVLINDAYTRLTGHTLSQVIGKTDKELFHNISPIEQIEKYFENDRKALELSPGKVLSVEETMLDEFGDSRVFMTKKFPVHDDQGLLLGVGTITFEITELKRAEREVRLTNLQLEKVNAEKDKLLSIIAHDLKSPLSGISSTSQILSKEVESLPLDEISLISDEIHKSSINALELLNDLMQWARMSQGGMDFSPERCSLHEIINESLSTARDMADKKRISIKYDIPQDIFVLADQPMFRTIIRNLVFNAVKFTNPGGNISVTAGKKEADVAVCVNDDGIGMNDTILSSIFTIDKSKRQFGTEGEKGTGLGLILCKEFVEKHGGKILVESEPDKGTKIFFTLPIADKGKVIVEAK